MMKTKFSLFLIFLFLFLATKGSIPQVINFTTKDYNGHSINYDIEQDSSGIIYIANAYGVLEYDGRSFRKIPLVQGKSAISLSKDYSGKIFVGSSSEFGYLNKDESQKTHFKSLKKLIPGNKEINEVFDTYWFNDAIYFACSRTIYRLKNKKIEKVNGFSKTSLIEDLAFLDGKLLYWESGKGLGEVVGLNAKIILPDSQTESVREIQLINDKYAIFGSFGVKLMGNSELPKQTSSILSNADVSSVIKLNRDAFLIGTVKRGLYLMNSEGKLQKNITKKQGLQANFIRKLFQDKAGNIWIAYNNGIGILKWSSPIQYITNAQGFDGMGYSGIVYKNQLFIGTSRGLYRLENWKNGLQKTENFIKVNGIPEGTINYLHVANEKLIICQAAETYTLEKGKAVRISDGSWYGSWIWKTADKYDKNEGFVGTYEGIERYLFKNNKWIYQGHIKGFLESSRVMEVDAKGIIWSIQGNKGLYRVELNEKRDSVVSLINYADNTIFKSDDFNDIFYFNNKIYITTFQGMYFLNNDSLEKDTSFGNIKKYTERARKYDENKLYGIYQDQAYLLEKNNGFWEVVPSEVSFSRSSLVGSAEFFNKIAPGTFLMGTQEGFALYKPKEIKKTIPSKCLIRNIEIIGESQDSTLFFGKPKFPIELAYENHNLRFTFSIPEYGISNQIEYQTQLYQNKKHSIGWQNVKEVNYREFTNLKEGKYIFEVRAKKGNVVLGNETYMFKILPPWYRTKIAKGLYLLLVIIGVYFIYSRFKKQALKFKEEKERELEIKEKLHKTEKLEIELKNKDNELAYMALSYTQKKEMLATLENKLDVLSKELEHSEKIKVKSLKRTISSSIDDESNWENFQIHFDQKNDNFFKKLKDIDSKLNESYLLFCSYVKMGKSNKEIAELMNISVAAVEKRKYRLKKKWGLENEISFTDYLRSL